jgi:hypothetical protein
LERVIGEFQLNQISAGRKNVTVMNANTKRLLELELEASQLRKKLGVARPGEVVYQASRSLWSDDDVVVEADGLGGAKL